MTVANPHASWLLVAKNRFLQGREINPLLGTHSGVFLVDDFHQQGWRLGKGFPSLYAVNKYNILISMLLGAGDCNPSQRKFFGSCATQVMKGIYPSSL